MTRLRSTQQGVVLLFALIALLILMLGAVALVRSFNTSLFQAGNIAFKRDLENRNDLVTGWALQALNSTTLKDRPSRAYSATTAASAPAYGNYSATVLKATNKQGIPDVLTRSDRTDSSGFQLLGVSNDFTDVASGTTITYVIDRLCASTGDEKLLGSSQCATVQKTPLGCSLQCVQNSDTNVSLGGNYSSAPIWVLYRVSARISGPRGTVSFFQSTIAVPS